MRKPPVIDEGLSTTKPIRKDAIGLSYHDSQTVNVPLAIRTFLPVMTGSPSSLNTGRPFSSSWSSSLTEFAPKNVENVETEDW